MTPTQKHTKSRKRVRRGALKIKKQTLSFCSKCKRAIKPHTACSFCGTYKGKETVRTQAQKKAKKDKREAKRQQAEQKAQEKEAKKETKIKK